MSAALQNWIDYFAEHRCWAMRPEVLRQLGDVLCRHVEGVRASAGEVQQITAAKRARGSDDRDYELLGSTAIVPISGVIAKYARQVNGVSQPRGTSVERIGGQLAAALGDGRVRTIFLHIESPGGSVAGLADLADAIAAASEAKPVIAYADDMAASAAYWLGSQASRFYANQTAQVGSIGVYTVLLDSTRYAEKWGLRFHLLASGEHKGVGELGVAITDRQLAAIQAEVDSYFALFRSAVLRGRSPRGMTAADLDAIADGRVWIGAEAADVGLIDGIKTLGQALASAKPKPAARPAATDASPRRTSGATEQETSMDAQTQTDAPPQTPGEPQAKAEAAPAAPATPAAPKIDADAIDAAARAEERERIGQIESALAGDGFAEARQKAIDGGLSLEGAKALGFDAAIAQRDGALADLKALKAAAGRAGIETGELPEFDPADVEGPEGHDDGTDDGKAESFDGRLAKLQADGKGRGAAILQAADEMPKAHAAWIERENARAGRGKAGD